MNDTPATDCPPGHRLVKLRKCCRCRTVYPEDEAVKRPHKKFSGATEDVCPKCGASSYYLHHAGETKAPRPEAYRALPWPVQKAETVDKSAPVLKWQPIDTAPKDGSDVLAWMHDQVVVARWDDQRFYSKPQPYWKSWGPRGSCADRGSQPLWWMPLPLAPEAAK